MSASPRASPRSVRLPLSALLGDQRGRFHRGEPIAVEDYVARNPGLEDDGILELIYGEFLLREEQGERPAPEEYRRRFPRFAARLADLFEVHEALGGGSMTLAFAAPGASTSLLESEPHYVDPDPGRPIVPGYEILDVLGRGGMGVVYRARDHRRGVTVALKTMRHVDATALDRFKQESRALQDVIHPNLVTLYELVSDGRGWFIAMELVDGVNFLRYVRSGDGAIDLPTEAASFEAERSSADTAFGCPPPVPRRRPAPLASALPGPSPLGRAHDRLRSAMRQLAEGVGALHAAGKLHRDLKPSNVLVTRRGRVVLLDFGLVTEQDESFGITAGQIVGTVAYMAPEQAAGLPLSPASDWYSVGVMLYEALTGRLPFLGGSLEVLIEKQQFEPTAPHALVRDVPEDLDALCIALLRNDPRARPSGVDVLRRLGSRTPELGAPPAPPSSSGGVVPLIGRRRHLAALADAFAAVRGGRTVTLCVHGRSGVGKSTLVRRFLDELGARGEAVVLAGRCYERESVPFKALDSLVDALCRHLKHLPCHEARALLPREIGPLARVFPVLRQVEAVAEIPWRPSEIRDQAELRRLACAALRALLARLGDRRPLVLAIDDLQWGDADSLAWLAEILRPPDLPRLLLLGCSRSEDAATNPFLRAMRAPLKTGEPSLERRELAVADLPLAEARRLALVLLGRADATARCRAECVARESAGNPLFIAELVRAIRADVRGTGRPGASRTLALDEVLWSRIVGLPADARRLLEIVAVSGRPLRLAVARRSLGLASDERGALALLRSGRLIRSAGPAEWEEIETYHDRIRQTVVAHLDPATLRAHHRCLARVLEPSDRADPVPLGVHR